MRTPASGWRRLLRRAASGAATSLGFAALAGSLPACSVETLASEARPAVANSCKAQSDCGPNGVCTNSGCYSKSGNIDEVLLEILPEPSSPLGGISFLSMQSDLRRGASARAIALSGPVPFTVQVQVNGEDLADKCPYLKTGKQTVAARVRFDRVGSVGGVSVAGLSSRFSVTVDTEQDSAAPTNGFRKDVSLVPGFYDIYAQPVASANCQIASKLWRGVEIARDPVVWAPPSTLDLPTPLTLNGIVQRRGGTLADWQVEIVDPQGEKIISSSARLGATTDASPMTNFQITFQPLEFSTTLGSSSGNGLAGTSQCGTAHGECPLLRLKPPKDVESTFPTVYFDLGALDLTGSGMVNLNLSGLPTSAQLVAVSGQLQGTNGDAVRGTLKFLNSFQGLGLPAAFGPVVTTDAAGHYATKLLPGSYRVVVVPEGATDDGSAVKGANPARKWALTERDKIIGADPTQTLDITVAPTRIIKGVASASAGAANVPAQGATLEASPWISRSSGVLQNILAPPIWPASVSVPVDDTDGKFSLVLDPGDYDFVLKPAATSNFAWWILPKVHVLTSELPEKIGTINPQLLYPVPLAGTITVASQPLRNAIVQAYARSTQTNVTLVGTARTDDMGRYQLALPPDFGSLP